MTVIKLMKMKVMIDEDDGDIEVDEGGGDDEDS